MGSPSLFIVDAGINFIPNDVYISRHFHRPNVCWTSGYSLPVLKPVYYWFFTAV